MFHLCNFNSLKANKIVPLHADEILIQEVRQILQGYYEIRVVVIDSASFSK